MSDVRIRRRRADDLRDERESLLDEAGLTAEELCSRGDRDELAGGQWNALERLRELDFLLVFAERRQP